MTTLIAIYLAVGFFSYWPALYNWDAYEPCSEVRWYHFIAAWALWCVCWPIRYAQDAWYWWRANR